MEVELGWIGVKFCCIRLACGEILSLYLHCPTADLLNTRTTCGRASKNFPQRVAL